MMDHVSAKPGPGPSPSGVPGEHRMLAILGGQVFDPDSRRVSRQDLLVEHGRIVHIAPQVAAPPGVERIDARGLIVTPGLIDGHVHAFRWGQLTGLDVDPLSSRSGVTTFVDGGSSGSLNFMAFRKFVIEHARSNLYALLNVSAIGQVAYGIQGLDADEYDDLRFLHLSSAAEIVEKNRDRIVGIKVRMYTGLTTLAPMTAGRELADTVGLPLVVHLDKAPPSFPEILPHLRAGDIVTHMYHAGPGCLVDRDGHVRAEYQEARKRGVLFDTGTARVHTCFPVARAALDQGFLPDTISTDLTMTNYRHITIDMPTTLSKFLGLGLGLEQVLHMTTSAPAAVLRLNARHGCLAVGAPADVAMFEVVSGECTYEDYFGNRLDATRRLACRGTIKDGTLLTPEEQEPLSFSFVRR